MPLLTPHVPDGLIELMKGLAKEVLRDKPENIYEFAAVHFEKLLVQRDCSLNKDYEDFAAYDAHFDGQQLFAVPASFGFKCMRPVKTPSQLQQRKSRSDMMTSFKAMESINEEEVLPSGGAEATYTDEKYQKAIYVIQRYYRRYAARKKKLLTLTLTKATAAIIIQRTMRKLFANKIKLKTSGEEESTVKRDEVAHDDVDNVSEAASYTSSSTIQMLADSQEGRENRFSGREEIPDGGADNGSTEFKEQTAVAQDVVLPPPPSPPPSSLSPVAAEGDKSEVAAPMATDTDRKSIADENGATKPVQHDEPTPPKHPSPTPTPPPPPPDDTSTAHIGILSTIIGSNDQQNSSHTNSVEIDSNSSEPTQTAKPTHDSVVAVGEFPLNFPQSLGATPDTLPATSPRPEAEETTFAVVRLQSNAHAENNAAYVPHPSAVQVKKFDPDTGESLKIYDVFYQDKDDPDFSDSLNESTMERDSLENEDLDVDSLESNENMIYGSGIAKREIRQDDGSLYDEDTGVPEEEGEEEEEEEEKQTGGQRSLGLERVPTYLYGIHPPRTPVVERKNAKNRKSAESKKIRVSKDSKSASSADRTPEEKSEEESLESKGSTSEESSVTQIENVVGEEEEDDDREQHEIGSDGKKGRDDDDDGLKDCQTGAELNTQREVVSGGQAPNENERKMSSKSNEELGRNPSGSKGSSDGETKSEISMPRVALEGDERKKSDREPHKVADGSGLSIEQPVRVEDPAPVSSHQPSASLVEDATENGDHAETTATRKKRSIMESPPPDSFDGEGSSDHVAIADSKAKQNTEHDSKTSRKKNKKEENVSDSIPASAFLGYFEELYSDHSVSRPASTLPRSRDEQVEAQLNELQSLCNLYPGLEITDVISEYHSKDIQPEERKDADDNNNVQDFEVNKVVDEKVESPMEGLESETASEGSTASSQASSVKDLKANTAPSVKTQSGCEAALRSIITYNDIKDRICDSNVEADREGESRSMVRGEKDTPSEEAKTQLMATAVPPEGKTTGSSRNASMASLSSIVTYDEIKNGATLDQSEVKTGLEPKSESMEVAVSQEASGITSETQRVSAESDKSPENAKILQTNNSQISPAPQKGQKTKTGVNASLKKEIMPLSSIVTYEEIKDGAAHDESKTKNDLEVESETTLLSQEARGTMSEIETLPEKEDTYSKEAKAQMASNLKADHVSSEDKTKESDEEATHEEVVAPLTPITTYSDIKNGTDDFQIKNDTKAESGPSQGTSGSSSETEKAKALEEAKSSDLKANLDPSQDKRGESDDAVTATNSIVTYNDIKDGAHYSEVKAGSIKTLESQGASDNTSGTEKVSAAGASQKKDSREEGKGRLGTENAKGDTKPASSGDGKSTHGIEPAEPMKESRELKGKLKVNDRDVEGDTGAGDKQPVYVADPKSGINEAQKPNGEHTSSFKSSDKQDDREEAVKNKVVEPPIFKESSSPAVEKGPQAKDDLKNVLEKEHESNEVKIMDSRTPSELHSEAVALEESQPKETKDKPSSNLKSINSVSTEIERKVAETSLTDAADASKKEQKDNTNLVPLTVKSDISEKMETVAASGATLRNMVSQGVASKQHGRENDKASIDNNEITSDDSSAVNDKNNDGKTVIESRKGDESVAFNFSEDDYAPQIDTTEKLGKADEAPSESLIVNEESNLTDTLKAYKDTKSNEDKTPTFESDKSGGKSDSSERNHGDNKPLEIENHRANDSSVRKREEPLTKPPSSLDEFDPLPVTGHNHKNKETTVTDDSERLNIFADVHSPMEPRRGVTASEENMLTDRGDSDRLTVKNNGTKKEKAQSVNDAEELVALGDVPSSATKINAAATNCLASGRESVRDHEKEKDNIEDVSIMNDSEHVSNDHKTSDTDSSAANPVNLDIASESGLIDHVESDVSVKEKDLEREAVKTTEKMEKSTDHLSSVSHLSSDTSKAQNLSVRGINDNTSVKENDLEGGKTMEIQSPDELKTFIDASNKASTYDDTNANKYSHNKESDSLLPDLEKEKDKIEDTSVKKLKTETHAPLPPKTESNEMVKDDDHEREKLETDDSSVAIDLQKETVDPTSKQQSLTDRENVKSHGGKKEKDKIDITEELGNLAKPNELSKSGLKETDNSSVENDGLERERREIKGNSEGSSTDDLSPIDDLSPNATEERSLIDALKIFKYVAQGNEQKNCGDTVLNANDNLSEVKRDTTSDRDETPKQVPDVLIIPPSPDNLTDVQRKDDGNEEDKRKKEHTSDIDAYPKPTSPHIYTEATTLKGALKTFKSNDSPEGAEKNDEIKNDKTWTVKSDSAEKLERKSISDVKEHEEDEPTSDFRQESPASDCRSPREHGSLLGEEKPGSCGDSDSIGEERNSAEESSLVNALKTFKKDQRITKELEAGELAEQAEGSEVDERNVNTVALERTEIKDDKKQSEMSDEQSNLTKSQTSQEAGKTHHDETQNPEVNSVAEIQVGESAERLEAEQHLESSDLLKVGASRASQEANVSTEPEKSSDGALILKTEAADDAPEVFKEILQPAGLKELHSGSAHANQIQPREGDKGAAHSGVSSHPKPEEQGGDISVADKDNLDEQPDSIASSVSVPTDLTSCNESNAETSADFSSIGKDLDFYEDTVHYLKNATVQLSAIGGILPSALLTGPEPKSGATSADLLSQAAVVIQSAIRGYRVRKAFRKKKAGESPVEKVKVEASAAAAAQIPVAVIHPTKHLANPTVVIHLAEDKDPYSDQDEGKRGMKEDQNQQTSDSKPATAESTVNKDDETAKRFDKPIARKVNVVKSLSLDETPRMRAAITRGKPIDRKPKPVKSDSFDDTAGKISVVKSQSVDETKRKTRKPIKSDSCDEKVDKISAVKRESVKNDSLDETAGKIRPVRNQGVDETKKTPVKGDSSNDAVDVTKRKGKLTKADSVGSLRRNPSEKADGRSVTRSKILSAANPPEQSRLIKTKRDQFATKGRSMSTNEKTQGPVIFDLEAIKKEILTKKAKTPPQSGKKSKMASRIIYRNQKAMSTDGGLKSFKSLEKTVKADAPDESNESLNGSGEQENLEKNADTNDSSNEVMKSVTEELSNDVDPSFKGQKSTAENIEDNALILTDSSPKLEDQLDAGLQVLQSSDLKEMDGVTENVQGNTSTANSEVQIDDGESTKTTKTLQAPNVIQSTEVRPYESVAENVDDNQVDQLKETNLQQSATVIQKTFRGYRTRKGLGNKARNALKEKVHEEAEEHSEQSEEVQQKEAAERVDAFETQEDSKKDSLDHQSKKEKSETSESPGIFDRLKRDVGEFKAAALDKSATTIQKTFRGYKTRKGLKKYSRASDRVAETDVSSSDEEREVLRQNSVKNRRDKEEKSSKELKYGKNGSEKGGSQTHLVTPDDSKDLQGTQSEENLHSKDLENSAITIQKTYRGYRTRKEFLSQGDPSQKGRHGEIPENRVENLRKVEENKDENRSEIDHKAELEREDVLDRAATTIQRTYKGFRTRRGLLADGKRSRHEKDGRIKELQDKEPESSASDEALEGSTSVERISLETSRSPKDKSHDSTEIKGRTNGEHQKEQTDFNSIESQIIIAPESVDHQTRHTKKPTSADAVLESAAASTIQKAYRDYYRRKNSLSGRAPKKSYSHGAQREIAHKEATENSDESSTFMGPDTSFDLSDVESVETKSEQVSETPTLTINDDKLPSDDDTPDHEAEENSSAIIKPPTTEENIIPSTINSLTVQSGIRRKRSIINPTAPPLEDILNSDISDQKPQWYVGDDLIVPTGIPNLSTELPHLPPTPLPSSSSVEKLSSLDARNENFNSNLQLTPSINSAVVSTSSLLFANDTEMHDRNTLKTLNNHSRAVSAKEEQEHENRSKEDLEKKEEQEEEERKKSEKEKNDDVKVEVSEEASQVAPSVDPFAVVNGSNEVIEKDLELCQNCAEGIHESNFHTKEPGQDTVEEKSSKEIPSQAANVGDTREESDSAEKHFDEIKQFVLMEESINVNGTNGNKNKDDITETSILQQQPDAEESVDSQMPNDSKVEGGGKQGYPSIALIPPSSEDDASDRETEAARMTGDTVTESPKVGEEEVAKDLDPKLRESSKGEETEKTKSQEGNKENGTPVLEHSTHERGDVGGESTEVRMERSDLQSKTSGTEDGNGHKGSSEDTNQPKEVEKTISKESVGLVSDSSAKENKTNEESREKRISNLKAGDGAPKEGEAKSSSEDAVRKETTNGEAVGDGAPKKDESKSSSQDAVREETTNGEALGDGAPKKEESKSSPHDAVKEESTNGEAVSDGALKKEDSKSGSQSSKEEEPKNDDGAPAEKEPKSGAQTIEDEKIDTEGLRTEDRPTEDDLGAGVKPAEAQVDVNAAKGTQNATGKDPKQESLDQTTSKTKEETSPEVSHASKEISSTNLGVENVDNKPNDVGELNGRSHDEASSMTKSPPSVDAEGASKNKDKQGSLEEGATKLDASEPKSSETSDEASVDQKSVHPVSPKGLGDEDKEQPEELSTPKAVEPEAEGNEKSLAEATQDRPLSDEGKTSLPNHEEMEVNTYSKTEIEANLEKLIDANMPADEPDPNTVHSQDLPTEDAATEVIEAPCVKKVVVPPTLDQEESEIESTTPKTDTTATTSAYEDASENESIETKPDALETMAEKLRETEAMVARMQKRRASEHQASIEGVDQPPAFSEPICEPIKPMRELQKSSSTEVEDDIILQKLQREDTTRESSAQSESVIFGESTSQPTESDDAFNENINLKTIHRMNTIAADRSAYKPPDLLFKSVTIDDTVKYIDPEKSTEESGGSFCLDDAMSADVRKKIMAYSVSEADSDYYDPAAERATRLRDDFNISTALDTFPSTDTDTTIISAATKIQAGARGFLTRRRLRRASMGTKSSLTEETKTSFGNDAIGESLDRLVEEEAAKRLPKVQYHRQVGVNSLPSALGNSDEAKTAHSSPTREQVLTSDDDKLTSTAEANLLPHRQWSSIDGRRVKHNLSTSSENDVNGGGEPEVGDESAQMSSNLEATLAARRLTLQRGDAMRNDSAPDDENGNGKQANLAKSAPATSSGGTVVQQKTSVDMGTSTRSERKNYSDAAVSAKMEKIKWFAMRQNSMPVQIDSEVFRVLPKHMRKRIKSAEGETKKRIRLRLD